MATGTIITLFLMYVTPDASSRASFSDALPPTPILLPSLQDDSLPPSITNSPQVFQRLTSEFHTFMTTFGKTYTSSAEKAHRLSVFGRNLMYIETHNAQNFSYKLKINQFGDLTNDEFKAVYYRGYRKRTNDHNFLSSHQQHASGRQADVSLLTIQNGTIPPAFDWRDKGCVTEVKAQKKCGSCWAFSASGAVEGAYCAKHGVLQSLSEQQMVDCAGPEGNHACGGGEMDSAFQYIMNSGGLCSETEYPYTAHKGRCLDKACQRLVHLVGYADVQHKNEDALKAAIVQHGPVSVAIEADQLAFQFYHSGVFDATCGRRLDHGVLVVGYGKDEVSQKDFWLVKNSWGPMWGESGFIKLGRKAGGRAGECGILLDASYPVVA